MSKPDEREELSAASPPPPAAATDRTGEHDIVDTPEFLGATEQVVDEPVTYREKGRNSVLTGLLFLAPNIVGFLAFTTIPLILSIYFAFTSWDLRYNNPYRDKPVELVGLANFRELFAEQFFFEYFGNTLFFMMAIPFGIGASLLSALLLSRDLTGKAGRKPLLGVAVFLVGVALALSGLAYTQGGGTWSMIALFSLITAGIFFFGVIGGQSVYRTLFYVPHFVTGVATYILWLKLYNTQQGPLTLALAPVLSGIEDAADATPPALIRGLGLLLIAIACGVLWYGLGKLRTFFREGDLGSSATFLPFAIILLPALMSLGWFNVVSTQNLPAEAAAEVVTTSGAELSQELAAARARVEAVELELVTNRRSLQELDALESDDEAAKAALRAEQEEIETRLAAAQADFDAASEPLNTSTAETAGAQALQVAGAFLILVALVGAIWTILNFFRGQELRSRPMEGFGSTLILAVALMVVQFILIGLASALMTLPEAAASRTGLEPPSWLADRRWVKPSLMFIGFWGSIGSNTMLLYIAALTNVPGELYEAADIDGATPFQRFWNVTWPQLAPTTFFIVVMAVIGGLQGGFEMVRVMTQGGPGGASTTLAYAVYEQGFEVGRVGYASAVAWAMFVLIFVVTLFNWTFGNRYVND
jgi:ABC-type sugar transport system permease subunit